MKIDAYTKFLLTVITLCLLYFCGRDFLAVPKVHADGPVRVVLVDGHGRAVEWSPGGSIRVVTYKP
jgi:hypothetical protein